MGGGSALGLGLGASCVVGRRSAHQRHARPLLSRAQPSSQTVWAQLRAKCLTRMMFLSNREGFLTNCRPMGHLS